MRSACVRLLEGHNLGNSQRKIPQWESFMNEPKISECGTIGEIRMRNIIQIFAYLHRKLQNNRIKLNAYACNIHLHYICIIHYIIYQIILSP